jgi:hypothetical protein
MDIQRVPTFAQYEPILDRLLFASGLSDREELARFLKCLRFRLNEPDRDTMTELVAYPGVPRPQSCVHRRWRRSC